MPSTTAPRNDFRYERYRARLAGAALFSLLVHALILSMQFGIPGLGLPSLELPWRERRAQAVDLQVVVAGAHGRDAVDHVAAAQPEPSSATPAALLPAGTGLKLYVPPVLSGSAAKDDTVPHPGVSASTSDQPPGRRTPHSRRKKRQPVIALAEARKETFNIAPPAYGDAPAELMPEEQPILPAAEPEPLAAEEPVAIAETVEPQGNAEEVRVQRDTEARQMEEEAQQEAALARAHREARDREQAERVLAEARQRELALREKQAQAEREARELALRREAEEAAREQEALALQRQQEEALRREQVEQAAAAERALELQARRHEEMRRQAEHAEREAIALQARKQAEEAERQAALERQRKEEDRRAQQQAAAEVAAQRAAANPARDERSAATQDRSAIDPARPEALTRPLLDGSLAGRALEQARRSEIFRSDVARQPGHAEPDSRRRSIFGKVAQDVGLMMYVEGWRLKIERNGNLNYQQSSAEKARGDPVVTVAIRSDGSVENVVIERSSGRAELDEAVRRIVRLNARYSAFPPELARRFDVIEIRRIWNFDDRLRILEEVR